jgi:hypothetical protein
MDTNTVYGRFMTSERRMIGYLNIWSTRHRVEA